MPLNYKYSIEVWTPTGTLLADLSGQANNIQVIRSRNAADDITFDLDLDKFENYCKMLNIDPKLVLITGWSEIRVKRIGTYLSGGQLTFKTTILSSTSNSVNCHARGFLWLFTNRLTGSSQSGHILGNVNENFMQSDGSWLSRSDMAWALISQSQALSNGSFGITRGAIGGTTTKYEKTYARSTIAQALIDMSQLAVDPIDFDFTPDKVFNTYTSIGSYRSDIVFEYPGDIISVSSTDDSEDLANEVIGLSQITYNSGGNPTQFTAYGENLTSQAQLFLRQQQLNADAVDDSLGGLTDETTAILNAKSFTVKLPSITLDGNKAPFITDYGIGDRVVVKINNHPSLSDVNGIYRIEQFTLNIDNGENEVITPVFSNLGTATNTSEYDAQNALIREIQNIRQSFNRVRTIS